MHTPQYTPNDVKIKPFNGQYSAPDMFFMATDYIMPVMPTANCFVLLAFFIGRLPPEGDRVSYPEIIKRTCINSTATVCRTINRLEEMGLIIVVSRNKRDAENIYRLNPDLEIDMPQNQIDFWLEKGTLKTKGAPLKIEGAPLKTKAPPPLKFKAPTPPLKIKGGETPDKTGDSRPPLKTKGLTTINTCNTRTCDHDHYSHEQAHDSHEQAHSPHERDHALMWKEALWHLEHQVMPAVFQGLFTGLCVLEVRGDCLVLQVHNEYQRAWLEKDHLPEILHIVQEFEEYQHITTIEVVCRTR